MPILTKEEVKTFINQVFPTNRLTIEKLEHRSARVRHRVTESDLRPGGTISGPVMMMLTDSILYINILAELGLVALAVTTNLNINFLRRPVANKDIIADCNLIKMGSRLVVGEVTIYSDQDPEPIAHAVGTYSIPPKDKPTN